MSETSQTPSGEASQPPRPAQRTPELSGDWEDSSSRVDWGSIGYFLRGVGVVAVFLSATTLLAEAALSDHSDKQTHAAVPELTGSDTDKDVAKHPLQCKNVDGLLRIVGVTAEEVEAINNSDDISKIPNMIHQRDADGTKADIQKFEWRSDDSKLNDVNDGPFFTALRYHFRPYAVRGSDELLGPEDVVVPGNAYNIGQGMAGQLLEYGDMTVCQPK